MNKLPTEILTDIFQLLHFQQKLECTLVCRAWARILQDGYLFETIELSVTTSFKSFDQRLDLLLKNASGGSQPGKKCKQFQIGHTNWHSRGVSAAKIAASFPKLRFLRFDFNIEYNTKKKDTILDQFDFDPFEGWRSNLETLIDDHDGHGSISGILTTGIFNRLTTLTILPTCFKSGQVYSHWLSKLKNTPALTTFTFDASYLSIDDLEELHMTVPKLRSLNLIHGFNACSNNPNLPNIIPAEKMKSLKITDCYSRGKEQPDIFLKYVKMKYPNLDEFFYREDGARYTFDSGYNVFSDSAWTELISAIGPGLKRCTISQLSRSNDIISLIDKHMVQLEYLDLNVFDDIQIFDKAISRQTFYGLTALSLHRLPPDLKMTKFSELTKLKKLDLDFSRPPSSTKVHYPIAFDDIVDELPKNIDSLCLQSVNVILNRKSTSSNSSIVHFKLCNSMVLDGGISDFMAQHFPTLKSLVLDNCDLNVEFKLPKHHLSYVEITPSTADTMVSYPTKYNKENIRHKEKNCMHFKITTTEQILTYKLPITEDKRLHHRSKIVMDDKDNCIQRVLKASDYDDDLKYFYFECASVDTIFYCNYHLLL